MKKNVNTMIKNFPEEENQIKQLDGLKFLNDESELGESDALLIVGAVSSIVILYFLATFAALFY